MTRSVIFNDLLGNSDAHGKNYALLYEPITQARLAPLYDLVSTAPYDGEHDLAMRIGDVADPDAVGRDAWTALAISIGVSVRQLFTELRNMADRVSECVRVTREQSLAEGWHHPAIDTVATVVARRCAAVRAAAA